MGTCHLLLLIEQLPTLPQLPATVDPDRWLLVIDGSAYVRRVGSDGCVDVDLSPYYIGKPWVGQYVTMHVERASQVCERLAWNELDQRSSHQKAHRSSPPIERVL